MNARGKGTRGEREFGKLTEATGWITKRQPGSGAFGTRITERRLTGDLRLICGDAELRVEVKRRKELPKMLDALQQGCEVLAMRADHGAWRVSMRQETFLYLMQLAAEALAPKRKRVEK